ncbi:hypothetical protein ACNQJ9_30910, partial [Pseudomonas aeruginosa]|uniref:hypothetical protein n=1 Tax=Pseudomonas aeruginosa TaxID=287 RepID=UPI003AFAEDC2
MSKVAHQPDPVMLDEQSFEQFGSDQVAYKIWCSIDTAFELLGQFDPPVVAEVALNIGKRTGITPCRRAPSCAAAARPGRWPS